MKKIIFVTLQIAPGHNRAQFQRAKLLAENFQVIFLLANNLAPELRDIFQAMICPGRKYYLYLIFFPIWAWWNIYTINKREHVAAVYTTYWPLSLIAGFWAQKLGIKWIADIYDVPTLVIESVSSYKKPSFTLLILWYRFIIAKIKKNLKKADLIVMALEPEAIRDYQVDYRKIIHITNGVDLEYIRKIVGELPKKIISDKVDFKIVYVGHIMKSRGVDLVIEAAESLKNKISNYQFILIGYAKKDDRDWLFEAIREKGIENYVKFLGELPHQGTLREVIDCDVCLYLFPKIEELRYIYPIKVFEYMALGKPTIATDLEGIGKIIRNNYNGICVSNGEELANGLIRLYEDSSLRRLLGENALISVKQFDWKKINAHLINQLRQHLEV